MTHFLKELDILSNEHEYFTDTAQNNFCFALIEALSLHFDKKFIKSSSLQLTHIYDRKSVN